jgi:hypothetical protein
MFAIREGCLATTLSGDRIMVGDVVEVRRMDAPGQ